MARNPARQSTDDRLEELEKKMAREYHTAQQELWEKATKYFNAFSDRDEDMRAKVAAGKITQEEYTKWRAGTMMSGKRYDAMINDLTWTAVNADKAAMAMTKGSLAETFADNANYAAYEVERATGIDTSFTLYNKDAVSRLIKDNPELLPALNPSSPTARKLAENKDLIWNKQHMTSALTQGILQGDSIGSIAKRLQSVTDMDRRAAVRNARTMTTNAENAGKMHSYERAKDMGIDGKQMWVATHDDRTRESHAMMDGETVDVGAEFSNKCRFPGDPAGDPSEVYNCRCSLVFVSKYSKADKDYRESESYQEWHSRHEQAEPQEAFILGNTGIGYSSEQIAVIEGLLKDAPEYASELYAKYSGEMAAVVQDTNRGYYDPKTNTCHFMTEGSAKGSHYQSPHELHFHEYGHNIDYLLGGGAPYSANYEDENGNTLFDVMMSDWDKVITPYEHNALLDMFESNLDTGAGGQGGDLFLRQLAQDYRGYMGWERRSDEYQALRDTISALETDYDKRLWLMENINDMTEAYKWAWGKDSLMTDAIDLFSDHIKEEYSLSERASLSDMFEWYSVSHGGSDYPFGIGHGKDYYAYGLDAIEEIVSRNKTSTETFAEMLSAEVANKEGLAVIQEYLPNAYSFYQEMVKGVL